MQVPMNAAVADEGLQVVRSSVDLGGLPPLCREVTEWVIAATGDLGYATDLICLERALEAAVSALAGGAPVVADRAMTATGVTARPVICKSGESLTARLARTAGISLPAAAARLAFADAGPGAIWLVGSEPEAIAEILARRAEPALVVGMPAGFCGAAEAKKALRDSGTPSVTNISAKGGPVAVVAAVSSLLNLAVPAGAASS